MAKATVTKNRLASEKDYAALEFGAVFTKKKAEELDRLAQLPCHGINRRVGLMMVARTKAQLVKGCDAELLGEIFDGLSDYIKHLNGQLEVMYAARVRALSAMATLAAQKPKRNGERKPALNAE